MDGKKIHINIAKCIIHQVYVTDKSAHFYALLVNHQLLLQQIWIVTNSHKTLKANYMHISNSHTRGCKASNKIVLTIDQPRRNLSGIEVPALYELDPDGKV